MPWCAICAALSYPITGASAVTNVSERASSDHLPRHQILADAEVLQRALRLRAPEAVGGHIDLAEAVDLSASRRRPVLALRPGGAFVQRRPSSCDTSWARLLPRAGDDRLSPVTEHCFVSFHA